MIKATELRIGSKMIIDKGRYLATVLTIVQHGMDISVQNQHDFQGPRSPDGIDGLTFRKYDEVEPIPLTPKILEKCGFEPMTGNEDEPATGWRAHYSASYMESGKDYFCIWDDQPCGYLMDNYSSAPLKYLHQLQNLFFALTGEELPIHL